MELNSNHPATREMHDLWHKIVGLLMFKNDLRTVEIKIDDIEGMSKMFGGEMPTVVFQSEGDTMTLRLLPMSSAMKLACEDAKKP